MTNAFPIRVAAVAVVLICSGSSKALAVGQAWVSSSGSDTAGCGARSAPCATFQYAHDHFDASGGEIDVADSGSYGGLSISKPLRVISVESEALIQGGAITIADAADVVIDGVSMINSDSNVAVSLNGSGSITLRNFRISNANSPISIINSDGEAIINLENMTIENCKTASYFTSYASGKLRVSIFQSSFNENNMNFIPGGPAIRFLASDASTMSVEIIASQIRRSGYGMLAYAFSSSTFSALLDSDNIGDTATNGLLTYADYTANTQISLTRTTIFAPGGNAIYNTGTNIQSFGDNVILGTQTGRKLTLVSTF